MDEAIGALLSPTGSHLLEVAAAAYAAGNELPAGERLRAAGHPPELIAAAFSQAELRVRATGKFRRAAEMFFTRDGLEQASSEHAARHRAARFAGRHRLADLCTGIGGDLIALAPGRSVLAVDRDPVHLRIALHNASVYLGELPRPVGLLADVRDVDLDGIDGVFVDPARRGGGRRLPTGASEPPLGWCFGLAGAVPAVAVKAAPGLARTAVPPGWETAFVADRRELRESVLYSPELATARRRATVLSGWPDEPRADELTGPGDDAVGAPAPRIGPPAAFLYDPSPAVTRAGLVGDLGRRLDAWQIDPLIAFLTSDVLRPTPFARPLRIGYSGPFEVRELARRLAAEGVTALDLRRRGLAGDVDALRRRLLPARGRRAVPVGAPGRTAVVVMTRLLDRPWAFVCFEPDAA
ncbi:MAG: class I SAM-dependent methyltransferase [Frankia sp.]